MNKGVPLASQPDKAFLCAFDTSDSEFDTSKVAGCLSLLDAKVWNFIPGVFVIVTDISGAALSTRLRAQVDCLQVLAEIDPATIEGFAPERAWDVLYFETLGSMLRSIADKRGWEAEGLLKAQQAHLEH